MAKVFVISSVGVNSKGTPFVKVVASTPAVVDPMLGIIGKETTTSFNICVADSSIAAANIGRVWEGFSPDNFDIRPSTYKGLDDKEYTTNWLYPRR
jgi:hypothetical protein